MSSAACLSHVKLYSCVLSPNKISLLAFNRDYRISSVCYGFKTGFDKYNIKWVRPVQKKFYDPARTGDLIPQLTLEPEKFPPLFEKSQELQSADPLVQKIFSNRFIGRKAASKRALKQIVDSVKAHEHDESSMEFRIATLTHRIRNLSEHLEIVSHDPRASIILNETIFKRRQFLGELRDRDYKKFEWILDKLEIKFHPHPAIGYYERIERKKSVRNLTDLFCEKIMDKKWSQYEEQLEREKKHFLKEKVETLKFIRQEQIACKAEPTVSEEDIQKAEKVLADFLEAWEAKEKTKVQVKTRA